ncbi:MAG: hypothetical protein JWO69_1635 [Thermoleophilia bacterium]|jgi:hypothetical protein|nr:hypothetical protein [Thermoleophilia bacterium]
MQVRPSNEVAVYDIASKAVRPASVNAGGPTEALVYTEGAKMPTEAARRGVDRVQLMLDEVPATGATAATADAATGAKRLATGSRKLVTGLAVAAVTLAAASAVAISLLIKGNADKPEALGGGDSAKKAPIKKSPAPTADGDPVTEPAAELRPAAEPEKLAPAPAPVPEKTLPLPTAPVEPAPVVPTESASPVAPRADDSPKLDIHQLMKRHLTVMDVLANEVTPAVAAAIGHDALANGVDALALASTLDGLAGDEHSKGLAPTLASIMTAYSKDRFERQGPGAPGTPPSRSAMGEIVASKAFTAAFPTADGSRIVQTYDGYLQKLEAATAAIATREAAEEPGPHTTEPLPEEGQDATDAIIQELGDDVAPDLDVGPHD